MKENGKAENLDLEHELPAAEPEQNGPAEPTVVPPQPTAAPEAEIEKLRAERDLLLDRVARLQAEFENARKRAQREQQDFRDFALSEAIKLMLPVLDSFDRALQSGGSADDLRSGMELIHRQLIDALLKLGVETVAAQGAPFDPNFHEALGMVETDAVESSHVAEELQRGYKLKGRLLRPAMVRVAK